MVSIAKLQSASPAPPAEPAWDIARLYPDQGAWDEWDYLALNTNHLVEFTDGYVKVLPMPTPDHQRIVRHLLALLMAFNASRNWGEVLFALLRVRLRPGKFREPDLVLMSNDHRDRKSAKYWESPDLVIEVVSEDAESRERDCVEKVAEYAEAGIPEYWIVDPQSKSVRVLKLVGTAYALHGEFGPRQSATSLVLQDFQVDVTALFEAAQNA